MINFLPDSNSCLICGSGRLRRFQARASDAVIPSLVNIVECRDCMFAWQYPLGRTQEESIQYFQHAYTDSGQTQSDYFDPGVKRQIAELELEFATELPVRDKLILDIGAGAGVFATIAAEHGWRVTAVDPTLVVDRLDNNPLINAIKGTLDQVPEEPLFDIVTLWDVIEHVTNPNDLIASATKRLKKGGWLLIETGNYKSADRIIGGMSHWIFQLDHRWYFSPDSISDLLSKAGFCEFVFSEKVLRPGWSGSISYGGPSHIQLVKSIVKNPLSLLAHIDKHRWLTRAKGWRMPGIGIFAIAAKK